MHAAWLFDVGSTYTKLAVVDLDDPGRRWRAQAPTTVTTDVREGFSAAIEAARDDGAPEFGEADFCAACSSAAGGLALVVSGLVPRLSAEAGRIAALGAGAKLVGAWSHRLTPGDIDELTVARPDIVLLCGGTDGGDRATLLHNAGALAGAAACPAVIVAGNREVAGDAVSLLEEGGVRAVAVANAMPELDRLEVGPIREAIRTEFLDNIIRAKGVDRLAAHLDADIVPTPSAVLDGVAMLAEGHFGSGLMAIEVGGATTNVHSHASTQASEGVVLRGLPEPELKRTVEGDLGVRWNAATILELAGRSWFERHGVSGVDPLERYVAEVGETPPRLPADAEQRGFDAALAAFAVATAIDRHCGEHREVTLPSGVAVVQTGKDLRGVEALIATGGSLINAADPAGVVAEALDAADPGSLVPSNPAILIDRDYVLFALGLLATSHADVALALAEDAFAHVPAPIAAGVTR